MAFKVNSISLENGLNVLHCHMPTNDISLIYGINAGSLYENANQAGLAHLAEHILFKGTYRRKNREEIYNERLCLSSDFFCHTSFKKIELGMRILKENFEQSLEFTEDILLRSMFTAEDITKEKEIVLDEMRIRKDVCLIYDEFFKILYEGHPYSRPIVGYENTILNLNVDEIKKFYQQHYVPSNMVLIVTGDIGLDDLKKSLEKVFTGKLNFSVPELKEIKLPANYKREIIIKKERENSEILVGKLLKKVNISEANILEYVLSKNVSNALLNKYSTSYNRNCSLNECLIKIYASCKKEHNKFVKDVIKYNITNTKNGNFLDEDIENIKKQIANSFTLYSQSSMYIAKYILKCWPNQCNNFDWLNTYVDSINAITKEGVLKEAQKHLSIDDLTTLIIGDF
ncbi:MAG: insulinase family protein [Nanoarchaeota archaeon]|nr:insulinase family protein [Nanoarchaeota archaeon]MBU4242529.1 insulinase family protein [Nanoarchaeota archaeon]